MSVARNHLSPGISPVLLVASMVLINGGCAVVDQKALEPIDWVGQEVEHYDVAGAGGWARLRNKPVTIGRYTAEVRTQSPWGSLPTSTTTDTHVAIGSDKDDGHELRSGSSIRDNDSELTIRLTDAEATLADIRCRQVLRIKTEDTRVGRNDGSNIFSMSELAEYVSSLNCRSSAASGRWPEWRLELSNGEPAPLSGILVVDGVRHEVVGSQSSNIGSAPMTVSFEIRNGSQTLALIDRSGDGKVGVYKPIADRSKNALMGAAAVLLLANDPLQP